MIRLRDAALVTSLFWAVPALSGTPIANSGSNDVAPGSQPGALLEALIAEFRYGEPEMGAVPYLPVPPPYRMRGEDAEEGGN